MDKLHRLAQPIEMWYILPCDARTIVQSRIARRAGLPHAEMCPMATKLVNVESIGSYFESLSDPRHTRNRKHLLVDVAVIAACGMLCGSDGPYGHPSLGGESRGLAAAVPVACQRSSLVRSYPSAVDGAQARRMAIASR